MVKYNDLYSIDAPRRHGGRAGVPAHLPKGIADANSRVEVMFNNLDNHLADFCLQADAILGCMAWLTNQKVLRAMQGKPVNIVVQKEDFLRPDAGGVNLSTLRALYDALSNGPEHVHDWEGFISAFGQGKGIYSLQPIRCVGYSKALGGVRPLMHHKFLVIGRWDWDYGSWQFRPDAVWTGSFNATKNGTASRENAVIIHGAKIASQFVQEFMTLLAVSEPLDWTADYTEPDWYMHT